MICHGLSLSQNDIREYDIVIKKSCVINILKKSKMKLLQNILSSDFQHSDIKFVEFLFDPMSLDHIAPPVSSFSI